MIVSLVVIIVFIEKQQTNWRLYCARTVRDYCRNIKRNLTFRDKKHLIVEICRSHKYGSSKSLNLTLYWLLYQFILPFVLFIFFDPVAFFVIFVLYALSIPDHSLGTFSITLITTKTLQKHTYKHWYQKCHYQCNYMKSNYRMSITTAMSITTVYRLIIYEVGC